jgi:putative transposase
MVCANPFSFDGLLRDAETFAVSDRRACCLFQFSRESFWYTRVVRDERALIIRLWDLAFPRVRFGYRRLAILLQREGWKVGRWRILRLYRAEGLAVRSKHRRKRASHVRVPLAVATAPNQRWSMDFVTERLENGRYFRILILIDQFSRDYQCLAAIAASGPNVAPTLSKIGLHRAETRRVCSRPRDTLLPCPHQPRPRPRVCRYGPSAGHLRSGCAPSGYHRP